MNRIYHFKPNRGGCVYRPFNYYELEKEFDKSCDKVRRLSEENEELKDENVKLNMLWDAAQWGVLICGLVAVGCVFALIVFI